jgi:hypothetical protein
MFQVPMNKFPISNDVIKCRFCFYEWDGELVNKSSFGSFVYWFSFLYSNLSKICGILFAVFTLSSLADQVSGRHEGGKKSRR